MNKKYALIVDDEVSWIKIFKSVLKSYYEPLVALSVEEADNFIGKRANEIGIAIVDIRLGDEVNFAGIDTIVSLREHGIRSIAVSAYGTPQIVRRALVEAGAIDFRFKEDGSNLVGDLRQIVHDQHKTTNDQNPSTIKKEKSVLWPLLGTISGATILIFATLTVVAKQLAADSLGIVIGAGITLVIIMILTILLALRLISKKDFKDLFKFTLKDKKDEKKD